VGAARTAAERRLKVGQTRLADETVTRLSAYGGAAIGYRFSSFVSLAVGLDAMKSRWELSDGGGETWTVYSVTAGITIGR
jgi:hypothetical protein